MQPANGRVPGGRGLLPPGAQAASIVAGFGPLLGDEVAAVEARGEKPADYTVYVCQVPSLNLAGSDANGSLIFQAQVTVPASLFKFSTSKMLIGPNGQPLIAELLRDTFFQGFPVIRIVTKRSALSADAAAMLASAEAPAGPPAGPGETPEGSTPPCP